MNRLKQLRLEKKMTLRELSDKVNIDFSALSRVENGKRNLNDNDISILTNFFQVSSDYLLGLSDQRETSSTKENSPSIDDIELAFYNQHGIVTEEQKKEVESFLKYIKSREGK